MESRFQRGTYLPGKIIVSSSKRSDFDYTEKRVKVKSNDPRVFIRDRANWEVKGKNLYSGKSFPVLVGAGGIPSEVLTKDRHEYFLDNEPDGCVVLYVPVEHANAFKGHGADLEQAIREVAGISTVAITRFFQNKAALDKSFQVNLPNYLTHVSGAKIDGPWVFGTPLKISKKLFTLDRETGNPISVKRHPDATRYAHIDLSLSGDSASLVIGHASEYVNINVGSINNEMEVEKQTERLPVVEIDLALSIQPPEHGQINIEKIRGIIYKLHEYGMPIKKVTMDGFQCFSGETRVFVLGYGNVSMKRLATEFKGKSFIVLAYNRKKRSFTYALAKNARKTGYRIRNTMVSTFSGGARLHTTDFQLAMLDSGGYKKVKHLESDESLKTITEEYKYFKKNGKKYYSSENEPEFNTLREIFRCQNDIKNGDFKADCIGSMDGEIFIVDKKTKKQTSISTLLNQWPKFCKKIRKKVYDNNDLGFFIKENSGNLLKMLSGLGLDEVRKICFNSKQSMDLIYQMFGIFDETGLNRSSNPTLLKREILKEEIDVYDIEVPIHENFVLSNGIVVHNSADSLQQFETKGFDSELLSVDRTTAPYYSLKRAVNEERLQGNYNNVFETEMYGLEEDIVNQKVDHAIGASKDLSDGYASVVFKITTDKPKSSGQIFGSNSSSGSIEHDWIVESEMGLRGRKNDEDNIFF